MTRSQIESRLEELAQTRALNAAAWLALTGGGGAAYCQVGRSRGSEATKQSTQLRMRGQMDRFAFARNDGGENVPGRLT